MTKQTHDKFTSITYNTLRPLHNVLDKVFITSLILYAHEDSKMFGELLYERNYEQLQSNLKESDYDIELDVDLTKELNQKCFNETLDKLIQEFDGDGFYKALNEGDEYAVVCYEVGKQFEGKSFKDFGDVLKSVKGVNK